LSCFAGKFQNLRRAAPNKAIWVTSPQISWKAPCGFFWKTFFWNTWW
jgi:hypothetical protein